MKWKFNLDLKYVDDATQLLLENPAYFDIIVTARCFGSMLVAAVSVKPAALSLIGGTLSLVHF